MVDAARRLVQEQIESFDRRYSNLAVDFACHAAFPLSLTTELSYCLREKFFPTADWSIAPQLLLSDLCDRKGHDLYAMDSIVRGELLKMLVENFGTERLDELADFMAKYIIAGIDRKKGDTTRDLLCSEKARLFGYPPAIIKFTALALLKPDLEITKIIKRELQNILLQTTNPKEKLQLAVLVENQHDLLSSLGFKFVSLQELAKSIVNDSSGDESELVKQIMKEYNFPSLQEKEIEFATILFEENANDTGDALYPFEFETVQIDETGRIIKHETRASVFREPLAPDIGLEMVAIPSGKFMMGSPASEQDRYNDESLQHEVTVRSFFIGKYPITQAQWQAIASSPKIDRELNPNPSRFKDKDRPVEQVSWEEAIEFCERLSDRTGRNYRLPTEAEWEYACRAGTTTSFYFGKRITGELANYNSSKTTRVGNFPPNAFSLYDMHGNVWEWCQDYWHDNYQGAPTDGSAWVNKQKSDRHVLRGGSWHNIQFYCRSAARSYNNSDFHHSIVGFRVVCEIPNNL